jgi:peptide/nickel transport system substrate-binding protein
MDIRDPKDLIRQLQALSKLTRRELIQYAVAAGFSVAATEQLLSSPAFAEPVRGGSMRLGLSFGATTDSLDPATWSNIMGTFIFGATLTEIDAKNSVQPNLVESFEPSEGAAKWTFKLRRGLTFHDGRTVEAKDVVATYNYHRSENSKSPIKSALEQIVDIQADDTETVIFSLKSGNADFPYVTSDYHLPIFPAKDSESIDWEKGVGAGPFVLDLFEPGVRITGKRFANYHKAGLPYFDDVSIVVIHDVTARINALLGDEIDYLDRADLKTISMLAEYPNFEIDNVTGAAHYIAVMNVTAPPFDNPDVRMALKYAINRESIVEKIASGYGTVGNDSPIAPNLKYSIQPEPVHKFDPDKVKEHLKKAGLDSLKIDLSTSETAFPGAVEAALLIKDSAAKAGIDINVIVEPNDGYWENVWMKKPFTMSYWGGRPTPDWMFTIAYAAGGAWNDSFWNNARFNELLVSGRAETDEAKRAAIYSEMQQLVHDDGGAMVLMFANFVSVHSKRVSHGELNSNYDFDGGRLFERWWKT